MLSLKYLKHILLMGMWITLQACGGGGGGGGGDTSGGSEPQPAPENTPNTYTVSASASDGGSIIPAGERTATQGDTLSYTITADEGYDISTVSGCDGTLEGSTYTTAAVSAACSVSAEFVLKTYTVSASAGEGGSIDPAGEQSATHGDTLSYTITADEGYDISTVSGCSGTLSGDTYTTAAITAACSVTTEFALKTYTVSASAGEGGSIDPAGEQTATHGDTLSYIITADEGYDISTVSGCSGTLEDSTYTTAAITDACSVSAEFVLKTYTVSASAGEGGSIDPAGEQSATHGSTLSYTIAADDGYDISTVTGCSGTLSGDTYTTVAITSACSVSAEFVLKTYTVSASAGEGGSIDPAGEQSATHGDTLSYTITADEGYAINTVTGCDGTLENNTYTTAVITAVCSVTAEFTLSYSVTASAGEGGSIDPAGEQTAKHGDTLSYTITADEGYYISTVTGCDGTLEDNTYTTAAITAACSVTAEFALKTYTVSASAGEGGSIDPAGEQTATHGDTLSYTITADEGYYISTVTGCDGTLEDNTYTTAAMTADCAIDVTFSEQIISTGIKLNDSGITLCGNYDDEDEGEWSSTLVCDDQPTPATKDQDGYDQYGILVPAGQDAHYGRDALAANGQLAKTGGGDAGFDFTKLDASGNELPETATEWSCVRDNVTGLIWEVKDPSDGNFGDSLHDADDTYSSYNTDPSTNGGFDGFALKDGRCYGFDQADGTTYCNTEAFVNRVNAVGLCGANDWRMPKKEELISIVHYGRTNPRIDTDYFPNSLSGHWSGVLAGDEHFAWYVADGEAAWELRYVTLPVRLVRSAP